MGNFKIWDIFEIIENKMYVSTYISANQRWTIYEELSHILICIITSTFDASCLCCTFTALLRVHLMPAVCAVDLQNYYLYF